MRKSFGGVLISRDLLMTVRFAAGVVQGRNKQPASYELFRSYQLDVGTKDKVLPGPKPDTCSVPDVFAAVGAARQSLVLGLVAGAVGAVAGTLGGAAARTKLAEVFGKDLPAALLEDAVAIILAIVVVTRLG